MTIDATFWVAISFFIFFAILIYLKVPQKIKKEIATQKVASIVINNFLFSFLIYLEQQQIIYFY